MTSEELCREYDPWLPVPPHCSPRVTPGHKVPSLESTGALEKGDSQRDLLLALSHDSGCPGPGNPHSSLRDRLGPGLPAARVQARDPVCTNQTCSCQTFQKGVKCQPAPCRSDPEVPISASRSQGAWLQCPSPGLVGRLAKPRVTRNTHALHSDFTWPCGPPTPDSLAFQKSQWAS